MSSLSEIILRLASRSSILVNTQSIQDGSNGTCFRYRRLVEPRLHCCVLQNSSSTAPSLCGLTASSPAALPSSIRSTPTLELRLDTFPLFSHLPTELQRTIWQLSVRSIGPRIIPIEPDDEFEDAGRGFRCVAQIRTPVVFSICAESRLEALRIYSLRFHSQLKHPIYFDKDRDILLMSRTSSMYSFLQSTYDFERITYDEYDRDEVQGLALLVNDTNPNHRGEDSLHGYPSWRQVSMAARTFANLKELRLVYLPENQEYTDNFQREKLSLTMFWNRHWLNWQQLKADAVRNAMNFWRATDPRSFPSSSDTMTQSSRISNIYRNTISSHSNCPSVPIDEQSVSPPDFVFWSRQELEFEVPTMGRWSSHNLYRRSRGEPEPLYGRNPLLFFRSYS